MTVPTPHAAALARIPVRERSVDVLGSTTRYWEYGPPDAANTVVIAHGYRGDHHGLEPVIALLPEVRFVGPDLPAFGAVDADDRGAALDRRIRALAGRFPRRLGPARRGRAARALVRIDAHDARDRGRPARARPHPDQPDLDRSAQGRRTRDERAHPCLLRRRPQAAGAPRPRPARQLGDRADHERHARQDTRSAAAQMDP